MRAAAGTKKRPIDAAPRTQSAKSANAAMPKGSPLLMAEAIAIAMRQRSAGTARTIKTPEPSLSRRLVWETVAVDAPVPSEPMTSVVIDCVVPSGSSAKKMDATRHQRTASQLILEILRGATDVLVIVRYHTYV
jgi:hypothetical protein